MQSSLSVMTLLALCSLFTLVVAGFVWLLCRRQYQQAQSEWEARSFELQEQLIHKDHVVAQINSQMAHVQQALETSKTERQQLVTELTTERHKLLQESQKCAGLQAVQKDYDEIKQRLQQRDIEFRQLSIEHESGVVKMAAETKALEEKMALLKDAKEQLNNEFTLLANRIFEEKQANFSEQSQQNIKASVDPLREQIESFRKKVEDAYDKENAERNKLVGHILELQKQTQQIGLDAINLTNALKGDNKAQGSWGEVILERLLEQSGLQKGIEYDVQVSLQNEAGQRRHPDVIVRLPEEKDIVIDSKVSLVHYEQAVSAIDDKARQEALKRHVVSMRTHIQQLSHKSYEKLEGIRSLDFVFLFVPIEAAFMAAMQQDPMLFQDAYDKHIILVSPTTLMATLRTVENIWRYEKQNRNAEEIARQAGGLYDQFALMLEAFSDIGKQLEKAQEAYDLTQKRWSTGRGNVIRRIEQLRKLGAKTKKRLALDVEDDSADEANMTKAQAVALAERDS